MNLIQGVGNPTNDYKRLLEKAKIKGWLGGRFIFPNRLVANVLVYALSGYLKKNEGNAKVDLCWIAQSTGSLTGAELQVSGMDRETAEIEKGLFKGKFNSRNNKNNTALHWYAFGLDMENERIYGSRYDGINRKSIAFKCDANTLDIQEFNITRTAMSASYFKLYHGNNNIIMFQSNVKTITELHSFFVKFQNNNNNE